MFSFYFLLYFCWASDDTRVSLWRAIHRESLLFRSRNFRNFRRYVGFVDYAVNLINLESKNLSCVTSGGEGLRETLFYSLFSRLQIYKTRMDMLQALPCITDGALSLDGGIIRKSGILSLGTRLVHKKKKKCLLIYSP